MHFSRPLGKVNVVYKPFSSEGAGQQWQLKQGVLQMEGGDRVVIVCPGLSKGKKMTCRLLANQQ